MDDILHTIGLALVNSLTPVAGGRWVLSALYDGSWAVQLITSYKQLFIQFILREDGLIAYFGTQRILIDYNEPTLFDDLERRVVNITATLR